MKTLPKKIILTLITVGFSLSHSYAQDYERLDHFFKVYGSSWRHGYDKQIDENKYGVAEQLGTTVPNYKFNDQLNSKNLKGKFVVMNFWSTWCGGCRALCQDLDSIMIKHSNEYQDVQIIGVNYMENLTNKGYQAQSWWKEKAFGYPTTEDNKGVEAFGKAVVANHPTAILIDDKGIIRGRWDSWTPSTANNIALAVWALKLVPEQHLPLDLEAARKYINTQQYLRALYILSELPQNDEVRLLKLEAMFHVTSYLAGETCTKMLKEAKENKNDNMLLNIVRLISNVEVYSNTTKNALDAIRDYNLHNQNRNDESRALECKLKYLCGKQMQQEAQTSIDEHLNNAQRTEGKEKEAQIWMNLKKELNI